MKSNNADKEYEVRWMLRGVKTVVYFGADHQEALRVMMLYQNTKDGETYIKTIKPVE